MKDFVRFLTNEIYGTWRYRWTAMIAAWLICTLGWFAVYSMPNLYQARTSVYVDAQSRLAVVMANVGVTSASTSRVFMVRAALLAREQLEKVIAETGLDAGVESAEERELLLLKLGEDIQIQSGRSSEARNLYQISYVHSDQQIAIDVVQTLLDIFVRDVLELKEEGSDVVAGYLDDQLGHYSGLLSDSETGLANFKKKYVGLLPGANGGIFERLQEEMAQRDDFASQLQIEINQQEELRRQLGRELPDLPDGGEGSALSVAVPGSSNAATIRDNEQRRSQLLLAYTKRHPDVVAIDEQLEQLYAQRDADRAALASSDNGIEGAANATNPVYQSVQIALNEAGVNVAGYRAHVAESEKAIAILQNQVDTIPMVEAEFAQLTRDYDQYRGLYSELLVQKERARLGTVGAERDVVNFNIIEQPVSDAEPVAPRRTLFIIGVLIFGLGIGVGTAYIIHLLNPVFMDAQTLRRLTGIPVLGTVSLTWRKQAKSARFIERSFFFASGTGLATMFVLAVSLQDSGVAFLQNLYS